MLPPLQLLCGVLITPSLPPLDFDTPACGRLIRREFALHELPFLIEEILSNKDERDTIRSLIGGDIQILIDVMDEARSTFTSPIEIDIDMLCLLGTGST